MTDIKILLKKEAYIKKIITYNLFLIMWLKFICPVAECS